MKRKTLFWLVVTTSVVLLTACTTPQTPQATPLPSATLLPSTQTPEPSATFTPNPTEYAQATLSANATNNASRFATSVSAMTGTASALVKQTATPSPMPSLRHQDPSMEELGIFLQRNFNNFIEKDGEIIWFGLSKYFEDVNGDGKNELIFVAEPEIFILSWTGVEYQKIFEFFGGASPRGVMTISQASFADWTNDGVPEVILDIYKLEGGTEYDAKSVNRWAIHCENVNCNVVWQGVPQFQSHLYGIAATLIYASSNITPTLFNNQPAIEIATSHFTLNDFTAYPGSTEHEPGKVVYLIKPTETQIWVWNGDTFNLAEEDSKAKSLTYENLAQLSAINSTGISANLQVTDPQLLYAHDYCEISVDTTVISPAFPCAGNFSQIQWLDITGDGVEEVVATMLFAYIYEYEMFESMIPWCVYQQRIVAYQSNSTGYNEIANIVGCVASPDLFGIRLEDTNSDGLPEILASSDEWNTSNLVYQWDGTSFVFAEEVCLHIFPGFSYQCRTSAP